jgi:hypothetical protein
MCRSPGKSGLWWRFLAAFGACSVAAIGTPLSFLSFPRASRKLRLWLLSQPAVMPLDDDWEVGTAFCKGVNSLEQQEVILSGGNHHILVAGIPLSLQAVWRPDEVTSL